MSQNDQPEAWLEASEGTTWPLDATCTLGRSPSNTVVISDSKVSRRHAVIHRQNGDEYWIADLGRGNGTYVNGMRLALPRKLKDKDSLLFGEYFVTFNQEITEDEAGTATTVPTMTLPSMTVLDVKCIKCWMLLADIIDSTTLAKNFDETDWATRVGSWTGDCHKIIERTGGSINKYLGDGFLAIWPWKDQMEAKVDEALKSLFEIQGSAAIPFRVAVHIGELTSGGGRTLGEDNLSGFELILLFRMEKLASSLEQTVLFSEAAFEELPKSMNLQDIGQHIVPGYIDTEPRRFFGLTPAVDGT